MRLIHRIIMLIMIFCMSYGVSSSASSKLNLQSMTCVQLLDALIKESSYREIYLNKTLGLNLTFERVDENHLMITLVRGKGVDPGGIYSNLELNLSAVNFANIDPDPAIPIFFNKKYIPYIINKCTVDQNIYVNIRHLPD